MSDQLVYDLSQSGQEQSSIFVKKDYLNLLDNQNGQYSGGQSVIDTSQLSNSSRYMSYREGYLQIPMLMTLTTDANSELFLPAAVGTSRDYACGLKNWYGSIIHSISCDFNGITVIQSTGFQGLYNTFKLMTTLSYQDLITQGSEIGFWPDNALSFLFVNEATPDGRGTCFNQNSIVPTVVTGAFNSYDAGNIGFLKRQQFINYDQEGLTAPGSDAFSTLLTEPKASQLWKSHILQKTSGTGGTRGSIQWAINGIVKLKHLHDLFAKMPLLKGVFLKMTLQLNNSSVTFSSAAAGGVLNIVTATSNTGGVIPFMIASARATQGGVTAFGYVGNYTCSIAVGSKCLVASQLNAAGITQSQMANISLNIPSYVMSPSWESAYLQSPIKKIDYEDIYQYQILNVAPSGTINSLITNGIAGLTKFLMLPCYTAAANGGTSPLYSPFDAFGTGVTSPLALLSSFQVVLSGGNMLYNQVKYSHTSFIEQLSGCNSINADLTDGLTSGLVGMLDFETAYCYYYVDLSRSLEIEKSVPKSVSVQGINMSAKACDYYVFLAYNASLSVDVLSGSRV